MLDGRFGGPSSVQSRVYDPLGAVEAGFLDEVVPEGQSAERACALAAEFAKLPSRAYAANKLSTRKEALEIMRVDLSAPPAPAEG